MAEPEDVMDWWLQDDAKYVDGEQSQLKLDLSGGGE